MTNLILHITLPKGLRAVSGATLLQPVTFDVISKLDPYYATVEDVRLAGGPLLSRLQDLTIACQVYRCSQQTNLITPVHRINPHSWEGQRFMGARASYVHDSAAKALLLNVAELLGRPGGHVLANFSVTRQPERESDASVSGKVRDLKESIKQWEVTIRSGGRTLPGGRPMTRFAAKGVMDWSERTPARTWGNGYGANATSADPGSPTGGRGKPISMFVSPMSSSSFSAMRVGVYQSGYPLAVGYPLSMMGR
jgi:hypothetical protein